MKTAKTLCYIVLVGCVVLFVLNLKFKAVWDFGNSSAGIGTAIVVAAILVIVARRAINSSR